jgi:hypothetical protein
VLEGTAIGGIFYPIMLDQLFKSSVGFAWGVRASAFVVLGTIIPGFFLMRTNPASTGEGVQLDWRSLLTDKPYLLMVLL